MVQVSIVSEARSGTGFAFFALRLGAQSIRYNLEEDRQSAIGHSFLVIPIRTSNKNYGTLAIEHTEKARFSDADVRTICTRL